MAEQMGVLCYTTVAGGYAAGSGVLNVASTSTGSGILPFPGSGSFSVCISDPTTKAPKALLEVTGINSPTQFAVTNSGGVDVSCVAGDIVTAVIDSRALTAILSGPAWVTLAPLYQNGWTDNGLGYQAGQYTKDGTGRVWLRGLIVGGTETAATLLFTLPSGFRPPILNEFVAIANKPGVAVQTCFVDIATNGQVTLQSNITTGAGSILYLNDISFSVN